MYISNVHNLLCCLFCSRILNYYKPWITVIYSGVVVSAFLGFVYWLTYPSLLIRSAFCNQLSWYVFVLAVAEMCCIVMTLNCLFLCDVIGICFNNSPSKSIIYKQSSNSKWSILFCNSTKFNLVKQSHLNWQHYHQTKLVNAYSK